MEYETVCYMDINSYVNVGGHLSLQFQFATQFEKFVTSFLYTEYRGPSSDFLG